MKRAGKTISPGAMVLGAIKTVGITPAGEATRASSAGQWGGEAMPDEVSERIRVNLERLCGQYAETFNTLSGRVVIGDFFVRYGFDTDGIELPSCIAGEGHVEAARRDGQKEVVRYVLRMCGARCVLPEVVISESQDQQQQKQKKQGKTKS
jgi:hypothetical protein